MHATRFTRAALATAAVAALSLTGVSTASALTPPAGPAFDPELELGIPQPDPCELIIDLCDPGDDVPEDTPEDDEPECEEVDECLSIPEDDDTPGEDTPEEEPEPEVLDETEVNPDAPVRANPNFTG